MDELLTVRECAAHLRVREHTLRKWIRQARIRANKLSPKRIVIRRVDLEEFERSGWTIPLEK